MAYLPVEFDLNDFQLALGPKAAAAFHQRMKSLGFSGVDSKGMMVWTRHDSRICALLQPDMGLVFLQDFYDHTPGGTIYAILEKMCVTFGGTMMGMYKIPSAGKTWGVRISQGLNVSGAQNGNVGARDTVQEEEVTAPSGATFQNTPAPVSGGHSTPAQPQTTQAAIKTASPANLGRGQVSTGQSGQASPQPTSQEKRDKLYDYYVDQAFATWLVSQPAPDAATQIAEKLRLIGEFNKQFPKEETEEEKATPIIREFYDYLIRKNSFGTPEMSMHEDEFDEYVEEFSQHKNANSQEYDYIQWAMLASLNTVSPSYSYGSYRYDYRFSPTEAITVTMDEAIAGQLAGHDGNPANQVQTSPVTPVQVPAPIKQVAQQGLPAGQFSNLNALLGNNTGPVPSSFNQAHAQAYASKSTGGNTAPMPSGWSVPTHDLEQLVRFAGATLYLTFAKSPGGFADEATMSQVLENLNDASLALQMFYDGRPHNEIWEHLWMSVPQGDVTGLLSAYQTMAHALKQKP